MRFELMLGAGMVFATASCVAQPLQEHGGARSLAVRVVGGDGRSTAGIPVILAADSSRVVSAFSRVETGEDGVAVFHDADAWLESGETCFVRLGFPSKHSSWKAIDSAATSGEPIQLELPPTGRVLLRIVDDAGRPLDVEGSARLFPLGEVETTGDEVVARVASGEAVIPLVGVGQRCQIALKLVGRPRQETPEFTLAIDERERRIDVQAAREGPWLTGRLLGANGTPTVERDVIATIKAGDVGSEIRTTVDSDGRFRIDASENQLGPGSALYLHVVDSHGKWRLLASASLPSEFARVVDVGNLRVRD